MDSKVKVAAEVATVVVSVAALLISVYFSREGTRAATDNLKVAKSSVDVAAAAVDATIKHNERSLRPLLDFQYKLGISGRPDDGGYIKLVNLGEGSAKITKITAKYDGKEIRTTAKALSAIADRRELVANDLKVGQGLARGGSVSLYTIKPRSYASDTETCRADEARKKFAEKVQIEVEYESLYGYQQKATFSYEAAESNCK